MPRSHATRLIAMLWLCIALGQLSAQAPAQQPPSPSEVVDGLKFLEAATATANILTSWAYAMIAGSIIALVGTSYYRPADRRVRFAYLAYLPAWVLLYSSIQAGRAVQGNYLGELFSKHHTRLEGSLKAADSAYGDQVVLMRYGLICFGLWLVVYLFWWVLNNEPTKEKSK